MRAAGIASATILVLALGLDAATAQKTHSLTLRPAPSPATIAPGKTVTNAWLFDKQLPGPTIRVTEGDRLRVKVINELDEPTTVHWHGLPLELRVDGVPGVSQGAIGPGQEYDYDFVVRDPGTYWYHPHMDLQIDRGLVGALIVDPKDPKADPPFDREHVLLVDDWLPGAPIAGRDPVYSDYLINGKTSDGQSPLQVKNGEVVRLRILNVSGATPYVFTVDGHTMRVTHADGQPVVPVETQAIPIGPGERYDVYVECKNPGKWSVAFADLRARNRTLVRAVLAYDGSSAQTPSPSYVPSALLGARLLGYADLQSAKPRGTLFASPTRSYDLTLAGGMMMRYVWTINGQAFPAADPIRVALADRVRFRGFNQSMMYHPMHLHGHFMLVHGSRGGTSAPLVKDTVLVPPGNMRFPGRLDVDWLADNPGNWAYHCHQIYHMQAGMMRLVEYTGSDTDHDGLADGNDWSPESAYPVTWTEGGAGDYRVGSAVDLRVQWQAGSVVLWYLGLPLLDPIDLGAIGQARISPFLPVGVARVGAEQVGTSPLQIPNDPKLRGLRVAVQGVGTHTTLPPGLRLSTSSYLRIR